MILLLAACLWGLWWLTSIQLLSITVAMLGGMALVLLWLVLALGGFLGFLYLMGGLLHAYPWLQHLQAPWMN